PPPPCISDEPDPWHHSFRVATDTRWVTTLQPWQRAPLVCGGTKTCLNAQTNAGWLWRGRKEGAGRTALLARLLAPFARRDAEPLLEDSAEMGEVVEAPREGDLADIPGLIRRVAKIALAALQPLRLDVAAERSLFG